LILTRSPLGRIVLADGGGTDGDGHADRCTETFSAELRRKGVS
jgi:hypothetical protein